MSLDLIAPQAPSRTARAKGVPDAEALIISRLGERPQYAIAPLDECYRLVGMIKSRWSGISGGPELTATVHEFFQALRGVAVTA